MTRSLLRSSWLLGELGAWYLAGGLGPGELGIGTHTLDLLGNPPRPSVRNRSSKERSLVRRDFSECPPLPVPVGRIGLGFSPWVDLGALKS